MGVVVLWQTLDLPGGERLLVRIETTGTKVPLGEMQNLKEWLELWAEQQKILAEAGWKPAALA